MVSILNPPTLGGIAPAAVPAPAAAPPAYETSAEPTSPLDIFNEALALGGTLSQAQVAAALGSGIESGIGGGYGQPQSQELAGGTGPAQGLFQFEPGTWSGGGKGGAGNGFKATPTVGQASWQQQVQAFLNDTTGGFGAWGPDVVAARGDPNSGSNPAYGYSGPVQAGSVVGNMIAKEGYTGVTSTTPYGGPVTPGTAAATGLTAAPNTTTTAFGGPLNPANWPSEFISALGPWVARIILIIVALILLKVGADKLLDTNAAPSTILVESPQSVGSSGGGSRRGMAGPGTKPHPVEHAAEEAPEAAMA